MSTPATPPSTPPGWYADPAGGPATRWWDGTQWTEHLQQPYSTSPVDLKAPEGVVTNTVGIWLIVVLPLASLLFLPFIDWSAALDLSSPYASQFGLFTSPFYLISMLVGWAVYGVCAWLAYRDWKYLQSAGVPRPFHFAWVFLSSLVYVIGRSLVVGRRTGTGRAPLWGAIGVTALSIVVAIVLVVNLTASMIEQISNLTPGTF